MIAKLAALILSVLTLATSVGVQAATPNARVALHYSSPAHNLVADASLASDLEQYVAQLDGSYGVAVENLSDGRSVLINSDQMLRTASMYKLLVMYRVFEKVQQGQISMDDAITITDDDVVQNTPGEGPFAGAELTVSELLNAMITYSSNSAAYALAREIGGWGELSVAADELGMKLTAEDEEFHTSPADLLRFFELLYDHSLVSRDASTQMMNLLLDQTVNDRIPALLPAGLSIAHKTGDLDDVRNDGGIVLAEGGDYIIVMMANGVDPYVAGQAESVISKMVYDRYGAPAQ